MQGSKNDRPPHDGELLITVTELARTRGQLTLKIVIKQQK